MLIFHLLQYRFLYLAFFNAIGAPVLKTAACRRINRTWHLTLHADPGLESLTEEPAYKDVPVLSIGSLTS